MTPTKYVHELSLPYAEYLSVQKTLFDGYNPNYTQLPTKYHFIDYVPEGAYYGG